MDWYVHDPYGELARQEKAEAREEYICGQAGELYDRWKAELDSTGIILDLGWEWADLKAASQECNVVWHTCRTPLNHLWHTAYDWIEDELK